MTAEYAKYAEPNEDYGLRTSSRASRKLEEQSLS